MTAPLVGGRGGVPDRLQVLDRPVDEAAVEVVARHGWHEGRGPRREHQCVVPEHLAVVEDHGAPVPVHVRDGGAEHEPHPRVVVPALRQQRQLLGALGGEERGEGHPVVRRSRLLADHHDVEALGQTSFDGGLDEAVSDHAVSDDHEGLSQMRHGVRPFGLG